MIDLKLPDRKPFINFGVEFANIYRFCNKIIASGFKAFLFLFIYCIGCLSNNRQTLF